jgi:hypothetical protein
LLAAVAMNAASAPNPSIGQAPAVTRGKALATMLRRKHDAIDMAHVPHWPAAGRTSL